MQSYPSNVLLWQVTSWCLDPLAVRCFSWDSRSTRVRFWAQPEASPWPVVEAESRWGSSCVNMDPNMFIRKCLPERFANLPGVMGFWILDSLNGEKVSCLVRCCLTQLFDAICYLTVFQPQATYAAISSPRSSHRLTGALYLTLSARAPSEQLIRPLSHFHG